MTDRWTDAVQMDGRTDGKIMLLSHTFTMRVEGSGVGSCSKLVKFRPVV